MSRPIKAMEMIVFDSANLTGGYDLATPTGLPSPLFLLNIKNYSSAGIEISYNNTFTGDFAKAGEVVDVQSNMHGEMYNTALFPFGEKIYLKGVAGQGNIYIVGYYLG